MLTLVAIEDLVNAEIARISPTVRMIMAKDASSCNSINCPIVMLYGISFANSCTGRSKPSAPTNA